MGAQTFSTTHKTIKSMPDNKAFQDALEEARFLHGHEGYSGTLAEKGSIRMLHRAKSRENAQRIEEAIMKHDFGLPIYAEDIAQAASDKGGPAFAIRYPIDKDFDGILIFGTARS